MRRSDFRGEIRRAWEVAKRPLSLDRAIINTEPLPVDEEFRKLILSDDAVYRSIYTLGLSRSHYNFILKDYSYFQFTWESQDAYRLAFYPNPWATGYPSANKKLQELEDAEVAGLFTHEEVSDQLAEMEYIGAVPCVRFELDSMSYREFDHPAAHFHIGSFGDNRWPCSVALGPLGFFMLVSKLYYPGAWRLNSTYCEYTGPDCIEKNLLRVVAEVPAVDKFSGAERLSFHWGRNT